MAEIPLIRAAVAIITDPQQQLLITQRAAHLSQGGKWEFPGGKLEAGESPEIALLREVEEEVGLQVVVYRYLGEVHYTDDRVQVRLYGYHAYQYRGHAVCRESQTDLQWVYLQDIANYDFPRANQQLIAMLY